MLALLPRAARAVRATRVALASLIVASLAAIGCAAHHGDGSASTSSEVVSCAGGPTVEGVDVSYFQGNIDWNAVKAAGREFAFIRVSDGTNFIDPKFGQNWSGARAAGVIRGVYQFYRPGNDANAQADIVINAVGQLGDGDLPAVLDVEVTDGWSSAHIVAGIRAWVDRVRAATGKQPILYTAPGFWNGIGGAGGFTDTTLWVANWGVSCPSLPYTWSSWKFWQWGDSGYVTGIPGAVDVDRFDGSLADLRAFAGAGGGGGNGGGSGGGLPSLDGTILSSPVVGHNADGRLEVFAVGTDHRLWTTFQTAPNAGWSTWYALQGNIDGDPAVGNNADGRLEVFARGSDHAIWHAWQGAPNGSFGGWESLGGYVDADPVVASNADGRLELLVAGGDGNMYHAWQTSPNGGWASWATLGSNVGGGLSQPALVNQSNGDIAAFARGADGHLYAMRETANGWDDWTTLEGDITSAPTAGKNQDGRLEVFARGADGALWHKWENAPGGSWSAWATLAGGVDDPFVTSNADGRLEVFVLGGDAAIYRIAQVAPNSGWSAWERIGGAMAGRPIADRNRDGRLEAFARAASDASVGHAWQQSPGNW